MSFASLGLLHGHFSGIIQIIGSNQCWDKKKKKNTQENLFQELTYSSVSNKINILVRFESKRSKVLNIQSKKEKQNDDF